jgi:hypothetical protein
MSDSKSIQKSFVIDLVVLIKEEQNIKEGWTRQTRKKDVYIFGFLL